jgi:hypothetical protein
VILGWYAIFQSQGTKMICPLHIFQHQLGVSLFIDDILTRHIYISRTCFLAQMIPTTQNHTRLDLRTIEAELICPERTFRGHAHLFFRIKFDVINVSSLAIGVFWPQSSSLA